MEICIFEDQQSTQLTPLVLSRPAYDLRCGIVTLAEKVQHRWGRATYYFACRDYLQSLEKARGRTIFRLASLRRPMLFINGRLLCDDAVATKLKAAKPGTVFVTGKEIVAAFLGPEHKGIVALENGELVFRKNTLRTVRLRASMVHYLWDIVHHNPDEITRDARLLHAVFRREGTVYPGAHLVDKENMHIAAGAVVKPGAVLDAETGPIIIDRKATIMSNAVLTGPLYVGEGSIVKAGAKIYGGTTIGPVCKVGGEVEESIIHGYSNKQHEGFLGHAYLGMWCNLGADTNNSDLKNNYSGVDVYVNGEKLDTGQTFVGLFMGDHAKSGINTMFNTGTVVGFASNVFGAGYVPKAIPSFAWLDAQNGMQTYRLDKAIEVAQRVMARRKIRFSALDRRLFSALFERTEHERKE